MAGRAESCKNKHLHDKFISTNDLNTAMFPEEYRTEEFLDQVKGLSERTVKVKVVGVSKDRPEFYEEPLKTSKFPFAEYRGQGRTNCNSSGFIYSQFKPEQFRDKCECRLCVTTEQTPSYTGYFIVLTSMQVVYDESEAKKTTFRCFYDDDEDQNEQLLYGVDYSPQRDPGCAREEMCFVLSVTHDEELGRRIEQILNLRVKIGLGNVSPHEQPVILCSHPHGWSKKVSVGRVSNFTVPLRPNFPKDKPVKFKDPAKCVLPYQLMSIVPWEDFIQAKGIELHSYITQNINGQNSKTILPQNYLNIELYCPINNTNVIVNVFGKLEDNKPTIQLNFSQKSNQGAKVRSDEQPEDDGSEFTPDPEELFSFVLPKHMTFTLPPEADFVKRQRRDELFWFPCDTTFHFGDGKQARLPQESLFVTGDKPDGFLMYKTPSCSGSAGGGVLIKGNDNTWRVIPHAGALGNGEKMGHCPMNFDEWIAKKFFFI